ncbi:MAG: hypothetical protein IPM45_15130 [Acidimicrobiales bacterium]|nr:hypothetical protein [Acidimicrobiales bacterium]
MPEFKPEDITKYLKDAVYVAIGFGVIVAQRLQVERVELQKRLEATFGESREQFETTQKTLEERMKLLEERLEALLDEVEGRLPEQAGELMKQSRAAAKDARERLTGYVAKGGVDKGGVDKAA